MKAKQLGRPRVKDKKRMVSFKVTDKTKSLIKQGAERDETSQGVYITNLVERDHGKQ